MLPLLLPSLDSEQVYHESLCCYKTLSEIGCIPFDVAHSIRVEIEGGVGSTAAPKHHPYNYRRHCVVLTKTHPGDKAI
jgi:hypothetical protein